MKQRERFIDTNVFAGYWPFRALPHRSPSQLKTYLSQRGITEAWIASSEAILYPDPMQGNVPLFQALDEIPAGNDFFKRVAIIDPSLATWERDVKECLQRWNCIAIKITPNYHQIDLSDPRLDALARLCDEANVPLCIQMRMMDERSHHPLMKVPGVDVKGVATLAARHPDTRFLLCGSYWSELGTYVSLDNIWVELSFVESGETLAKTLPKLDASRICFGSHSPYFYFEAVEAKLNPPEGEINRQILNGIRYKNCQRLLTG